jgi:hypothetical protein
MTGKNDDVTETKKTRFRIIMKSAVRAKESLIALPRGSLA